MAQVQISDLLSACLPLRHFFVRPLTGNALQKFNKKNHFNDRYCYLFTRYGQLPFSPQLFFLLLAVRILHGAGFGITTTTYGTVVSDLIPSARRGEGMGYFGLSGTLAMALGPLIGLWLMQTYNFTILFFMCIIVHNCFININETTSNPKKRNSLHNNHLVLFSMDLLSVKLYFLHY